MSQAVTHPSAQVLAAYGLGKLARAAADTVAGHLETCSTCQKTVAAVQNDSFVGKLKAAKPGASALPQSLPYSQAGTAALPVGPLEWTEKIPEQLANHPKFRIVRVLGKGGMGVIYLAEHRVMEKSVALKVISPAVLNNPDALARFHGEAKAAGRLDHPNIARAYDADQAGDLHFLVMEFVEGVSLWQHLDQKGMLPLAHACHYASQAALGLQHAFEQDMVHRDIKPHNLMLTPKGIVKVLDFGLARLRSERMGGGGITQADAFMGTPEYVSPEQATDARQADTRADIYSLGCTLYALLMGRPPFQENTAMKLVLAHIEKVPALLHELRPEVPVELSAVVARMLAKDPARRYQKPIEVAKALERFIKGGTKQSVKTVPVSPKAVGSPEKGTLTNSDTGKLQMKRANEAVQPAAQPLPKQEMPKPVEKQVAALVSPKQSPVQNPRTAALNPKWLLGGGAAILLLSVLLGVAGLWAGVFKVKTKDGTIVLENLPPDADVSVDGGIVTVKAGDGKSVEIRVDPDKKHRLEVKKDGFKVFGEEVELVAGDRKSVVVRLEPTATTTVEPIPYSTPKRGLNALKREAISMEALTLAGNGEPKRAPSSLVAVLGEVVPNHDQRVNSLAFSADGRWLASGSFDKTVILWEASTGRARRVLRGHTQAVTSVAFSKDGKTLVSASQDGTLKLWSTEKEADPQTLQPKLGEVWAMAASPDGQFLAAGGAGGAIKLWKWGQWDAAVNVATTGGKVTALAFNPDSKTLAAGSDEQKPECPIRLYKTSDGKIERSWTAHERYIHVLTFTPDGKYLASTGGGKSVKVWELSNTREPFFESGNYNDFYAAAFSTDGKALLAGLSGVAFLFNFTAAKPSGNGAGFNSLQQPSGASGYRGQLIAAAYSPDGKRLAIGTATGQLQVWDMATGEPLTSKGGHPHHVTALAFSPDGRTILSGGDDFTLRRWNCELPGENQIVRQFDRSINDVAFSPDGKKYGTVASFEWYDSSQRGEIWDSATDKRLFHVDPPEKSLPSLVFSPDAKTFAGTGADGSVRLWSAGTGKELHRFPQSGWFSDRPAFSGDGKILAAVSDKTKLVKVWEVESGKEIHSWEGAPMFSVTLSPDGHFLAAGHWDGTISLWDLEPIRITPSGRKL